jgi:hypothetical protein
MAFTTEEHVRERFLPEGDAQATTNQIACAIDAAHLQIAPALRPDAPLDPPSEAIVLGETLLAGARLFEALAAHDAYDQRRLKVGHAEVREGERFRSLMAAAADAESRAWEVLAPFMAAKEQRVPAAATDSQPVLGEE